jgi:hypothetical protein
VSTITMKTKIIEQANLITLQSNQINSLLVELYRAKPKHKIFIDSPNLALNVKKLSDKWKANGPNNL